jgi:hypothetical protein
VTNHLSELGLTAIGYDIAPGMIVAAQRGFPNSNFQVGDLTALDVASSSLAGIVARYSFIHMPLLKPPASFVSGPVFLSLEPPSSGRSRNKFRRRAWFSLRPRCCNGRRTLPSHDCQRTAGRWIR